MKAIAILIALAALVAGCATKNYGRQGELTDYETRTLNCREIELETARVHGFLSHVQKESEFDARSVLSFLGDFGIGNLMERNSAVDSATARLAQLQSSRTTKGCGGAAALADQAAATGARLPDGATSAGNPSPAPAVKQGKDAYQAERMARDAGCGSRSSAAMLASGPGFETYNFTCVGGDVMVMRCEFGNCRVLR